MKDFLPPPAQARAALAPLVRGDLDGERARRIFATYVWSWIIEPGDGVAGRLVATLGAEAALHEVIGGGRDGLARDAASISAKQWGEALERWRPRLGRTDLHHALDIARHAGLSLLTPEDPGWPAPLADLGDHAPLLLWVRGDVGALTRSPRSISVVGARAATSYGEHVAMELSADLAGQGVSIVSGAAYGIDGAAR